MAVIYMTVIFLNINHITYTKQKERYKDMNSNDLIFSPLILPDILRDRTTGKNIVWATDTYSYAENTQMYPEIVLNLINQNLLIPRIEKTKEQQKDRTKKKAEVFTPSWICNKMNNFCDNEWFGREGVFNREVDNGWVVNTEKIEFKNIDDWKKYVNSQRLEITCGEAPFIASRYDTTTGEYITIQNRIGMLDRKLRVVNENTDNENDWLEWTFKAFQSVYGYEYQGDNLFYARVNLVMTFIEYYQDRFNKQPLIKDVKKIIDIVTWNLWQMDGLKDTTPYGIPCKIKDWQNNNNIIEFRSIKENK